MRAIQTSTIVKVPENVQVELKGRLVKVTGPRGTLERNFGYITLEITRPSAGQLKVSVWFGAHKHIACIRTICSHICNMIKGVTIGFEYKMLSAYSHFPINVSIVDNSKTLEIRNFIGEKIVRRIPMLEGVTIQQSTVKDELILRGNDLDAVSQSAATIQNMTKVKNKDIRKFLDGIFVSSRGNIVTVE